VLLLAILATNAKPVEATIHTLTSGNSTVTIDPNTSNGVYAWVVDGVPQLAQQWYWLRVGSGPEVPLSSLSLIVESGGSAYQRLDYSGAVGGVILQIALTYSLVGGSPGSRQSQIFEQMTINAPLERSDVVLHVFRYTDLDLAGTSAGDRAEWLQPDTIRQFKGQVSAEGVAAPAPSHFGIGFFPSILSLLSDASPTTLADSPASLGPGNVTFAVQWDLPLPSRTTATANHTTRIGPPVRGDFDGDGRTDLAVFHDATGLWFIRSSATGTTTSVGYGGPGYQPVPADYDGDGKSDLAVYHPPSGLWFVRSSSTGTDSATGFGGTGYAPVRGDFDGDGKTDLAVFHDATGLWFIQYSSTGAVVTVGYGGTGYIPVPGDYDGDGKTDIAVYHPPTGLWFIRSSSTGTDSVTGFGGSGFNPAN
jgi:hypothetical protein